eukprot:Plantae.Rhodophyta-Purpureofilum_apyrenoidigerum.ctg41618.p1 GENE.Plantae.Rhodophyta-Purpureofilum_apyrenoidigerum.ctg41618~~Plantae.Rhodophyta-Purpureofilum_apyrenoidigerum.ctg41618.p1  ORF type:complete len:407 (+),score=52.28 Plantae.Rhodophyta-Purpureofilum_apyrenoidigerum.ctg41618:74-1222(+)
MATYAFVGSGAASKFAPRRAPALRRSKVAIVAATKSGVEVPAQRPMGIDGRLLLPTFVGLSVTNRVLHRTLLVPMREYTFLVSQFVAFAYVVIYGSILYRRRKAGIVSDDMLRFARSKWTTFVAIGGLEALTFTIQLYTAARLPGGLIGILSQGILPFTMVLSAVFRGKRYSSLQIMGVVVLILGVLTSMYPSFSSMSPTVGTDLVFHAILYFVSAGFIALALVLKESALQSGDLDVFVVNTSSSFMQLIGTIVLLPFSLTVALGPHRDRAGSYIAQGLQTLAGQKGTAVTPLLGVTYVLANVTMNIIGLTLIKRMSAVATIVSSFITVPLVSLVFCLRLPMLVPTPFSPIFLLGVLIVMAGLAMYNWNSITAAAADGKRSA